MKLGPTGKFPQGSLGPLDEGGLAIGVARDNKGNVIINFGAKVSWLAMSSPEAIEFAKLIMNKAGAKDVTIKL